MEQLLRESEPLAAETLYGAILDGWLAGATHTIDSLPASYQPPPIAILPGGPPGEPPPAPPSASDFFDEGEPPPGISLTAIDNAVAALSARQVMQAPDFYALAGAAKQQAFTLRRGKSKAVW